MVNLAPTSLWLVSLTSITTLFSCAQAAACKTAIVGKPYNNCFDIYTAAKITAAQFSTYNPGLNCATLLLGQKVCISAGTLPSNAPSPSKNGTCAQYWVAPNDSCSSIAVKFDVTVAKLQTWNAKTYKWTGCAHLQAGFDMCVSSGTPPPIPVNPDLQCGPESRGNATCPLKACCSAFGFCGLTTDFCHTTSPNPCVSNCFTSTLPSCGTAPRTMRNIGYYAGWADRRPCGTMRPSQIDWKGYTHANFAFAVIGQDYKIALATADIDLLKELVAQKQKYTGMRVLIAVGGWDFSEAGATRDVFSAMIGTAANRATFVASAKAMIATYGLDGIDIDFEYPGAVERNAPATDTPSLTALFKELRAAIPGIIISCATPSGYWFLKGFEIDKIIGSIDYLNMMSYDYHGQWDTDVKGQPSVSNPHTSLEDIKASALLYSRAGVPLSKVNLGLAWYGRTYHLADAACKGYNCTMVGGGAPGKCSRSSGYLTQFEITDILAGGIKPTLDKLSQTYWYDSGGDLVTFDQTDTWNNKKLFALSACFGGTFVWSMDQILGSVDSVPGSGSGGIDTYSIIPWNPNPHPKSGAQSETFIGAGTTVAIPTPTTTTFITVGGTIITLNSGGTPVDALLPSTISEPNAVTPTWTYKIVPPASPMITFTAPITPVSGASTFSTAVASPSPGAAVTVSGPGGVSWTLTAGPSGPSVLGNFPSTIGISGGETPLATPPPGWLGPWTDPVPPHRVTTKQPAQVNTEVTWNPNPFPAPTAISETFICSGTTTSFAKPTATTTVSAGGATIVLNPGGTPVNGPLATQCTEVGGILPTWSMDIIPPPGAATITFTGPLTSTPTWLTTVPVPPRSDSPEVTVTGPPGDKNRCNDRNFWSILFGIIIHDCLPLDVGIIGGITPVPIPPPGWTGPWKNPIPRPTPTPVPGGDDSDSTSTSQSSSSTSSTACPPKPTNLYLPDPVLDADDSDRRRHLSVGRDSQPLSHQGHRDISIHQLFRRENRHIKISVCNIEAESPLNTQLGRAPYYTLVKANGWNTVLEKIDEDGRPISGTATAQEHVFEFQQFSQFVTQRLLPTKPTVNDCDWVKANIFDYVRANGGTMGIALVSAIDQMRNMVWVDEPLNQAKTSVVGDLTGTAANPPHGDDYKYLTEEGDYGDYNLILKVEYFLRSLAALGQYFQETAPVFKGTAQEIINILSEITPSSPPFMDASIPLIFYTWLGTTLRNYNAGTTMRGNNAWDAYRKAMQAVAAREGQPVPSCFQLYTQNQFNPTQFNFQPMMPNAPQAPQCNPPGTTGFVHFVQSVPQGVLAPIGTLAYGGVAGNVRIMGSGNPEDFVSNAGLVSVGTV